MNYTQTLDYLYSKLPMFTRMGVAALKKDLYNTLFLCKYLGNPQHKFKSIHVAGTNGKGSTSHMLAAILQTAGYKTGLYTSPHLTDFRERIRIDGEMIPQGDVVAFVSQIKGSIEQIEPSFFEVTVAMAFDYFAREQVDIAVIEVGLGGRLDSTNVITPVLSVITNISMDHMNILGNSLQAIAFEKAGIIKAGIPVVVGERQEETAGIFEKKALEEGSDIFFASDEWQTLSAGSVASVPTYTFLRAPGGPKLDLQPDLTGVYQEKNLKTVLEAVRHLKGFELAEHAICDALEHVQAITGLKGRWQIMGQNPLIVCDTGHNEAGIKEVLKGLGTIPYDRLHMVFGVLKDKDPASILSLLPKEAIYYFCSPNLERAMPGAELQDLALAFGLGGATYGSVSSAFAAAKNAASPADMIFIGGSTFVVAEVI